MYVLPEQICTETNLQKSKKPLYKGSESLIYEEQI